MRRQTMRNPIFKKEIFLIAVLLFLAFSFVWAADKVWAADNNIKKTRGKVETVDLKKKFFVVNESEYFWIYDTTFSDEKGIPVKIDRLKPKASVFIEWRYVKGGRKRIAERVCIYNEEE
jgi:hypothetical protein